MAITAVSRLSLVLALFSSIQGQRECPSHRAPTYGYSECTDGRKHRSICASKCDRGYIVKGPSRMFCWCRNDRCRWTGRKATCEKSECKFPDLDTGHLRFVDRWEGGFAGLIEFGNVVTPSSSTYGWSVVVVFDRPLGKKVRLTSWNLDLTATSFDGQTFTFANPENSKDLSKVIDSSNRFSVLVVAEGAGGDIPESAFAGLYYKRVKDATCLMAPRLPVIRPLYSDSPKTPPVTIPVTKTTTYPVTNRIEDEQKDSKQSEVIGSTKNASDVTPTTSASGDAELDHDEVFCKAQSHYDSYVAGEGWEDQGVHFIGGYFNLEYPEVLADWQMVVIFNEAITKIQTWVCEVKDSSKDGLIWTFGPNPGNTKFHGKRIEIRYIATQSYATVERPTGQVFLCSTSFKDGEAKIKGSGLGSSVQSLATPQPDLSSTTKSSEGLDIAESEDLKCSNRDPTGKPVIRAEQTKPNPKANTDGDKYNYNELLHISLLFYEAQRAGKLPPDNRIPWRGDAALKDGCDIKRDLTGGWFDAGDRVKFNFPIAFTLTTLSWGAIEFRDAYEDAGELDNIINTIKWGAEYFIKTHIGKNIVVAQVGHGQTDHNFWGRPEEMQMSRPTYVVTEEKPGSDLCSEIAASLAAASIFLRQTHPELADEALQHSKEIFDFANKFRAKYSDSVQDTALYYKSWSGFQDELLWAAAWLYKASNDSSYLEMARKMYGVMGGKNFIATEFSWDQKMPGAQALLADMTKLEEFRKPFTQYLNAMPRKRKTPAGLYYIGDWGTNRYAANAAFMLIMGNRMQPPLPKREQYILWARRQIQLLLGDAGRSFVIGFGKNPPVQAHHAACSCPPYPERCDWTIYHSPKPNHYILYGGLVGGPNVKGFYNDNRSTYQESEVACDYNAGFQSAIAGLKEFAMRRNIRKLAVNSTSAPTTKIQRTTAKSEDSKATTQLPIETTLAAVTEITASQLYTNTAQQQSTSEILRTKSEPIIIRSTQFTRPTTKPKKKQCKPKRSKKCVNARKKARKAAALKKANARKKSSQ